MLFITLMTKMSDTAEAKYKYGKNSPKLKQGATGTSTGRRTPRSPRLLTQPSRGSLYPVLAFWAELGDPVVLPAVEPAKGASVDNFWHNDLFARICSTCGGVE